MLANSDSGAAADKVTLINNCVYAACCLSLSANYTQHSIGNRKQCKQTHTHTHTVQRNCRCEIVHRAIKTEEKNIS